MLQILDTLFEKFSLSSEEREIFEARFLGSAFLLVGAATIDKCTDSERKEMKRWWNEKKLDEIWKLFASKYSSDEWKALVKEKIAPFVDGYMKLQLGEVGKDGK